VGEKSALKKLTIVIIIDGKSIIAIWYCLKCYAIKIIGRNYIRYKPKTK
jgi:hypothetical protein